MTHDQPQAMQAPILVIHLPDVGSHKVLYPIHFSYNIVQRYHRPVNRTHRNQDEIHSAALAGRPLCRVRVRRCTTQTGYCQLS